MVRVGEAVGAAGISEAPVASFSDLISVDELAAAMHGSRPLLIVDVRFTLQDGPLFGEYL